MEYPNIRESRASRAVEAHRHATEFNKKTTEEVRFWAILPSDIPNKPLLTWSCQLHQPQTLYTECCKPDMVHFPTDFFVNAG